MQIATDAPNNPLYINKAFVRKNFFMHRKHTDKTIAQMSKARKGTIDSDETRKRKSIGRKDISGTPHTQESRAKQAEKTRGSKRSAESKAIMSTKARRLFYLSPIRVVDVPSGFEPIITKCSILRWCNNSDKKISKISYINSKYLRENYSNEIIGKTYGQLGFYRINKTLFCLI